MGGGGSGATTNVGSKMRASSARSVFHYPLSPRPAAERRQAFEQPLRVATVNGLAGCPDTVRSRLDDAGGTGLSVCTGNVDHGGAQLRFTDEIHESTDAPKVRRDLTFRPPREQFSLCSSEARTGVVSATHGVSLGTDRSSERRVPRMAE